MFEESAINGKEKTTIIGVIVTVLSTVMLVSYLVSKTFEDLRLRRRPLIKGKRPFPSIVPCCCPTVAKAVLT